MELHSYTYYGFIPHDFVRVCMALHNNHKCWGRSDFAGMPLMPFTATFTQTACLWGLTSPNPPTNKSLCKATVDDTAPQTHLQQYSQCLIEKPIQPPGREKSIVCYCLSSAPRKITPEMDQKHTWYREVHSAAHCSHSWLDPPLYNQ